MVRLAQQNHLLYVCVACAEPERIHMVRFALFGRPPAAGEDASLIAEDQSLPLLRGGEAARASLIQDLGLTAQHEGDHRSLGGKATELPNGEFHAGIQDTASSAPFEQISQADGDPDHGTRSSAGALRPCSIAVAGLSQGIDQRDERVCIALQRRALPVWLREIATVTRGDACIAQPLLAITLSALVRLHHAGQETHQRRCFHLR